MLYHLQNSPDPEIRARIPFVLGHAVSSDLVHWQADIPVRGGPVDTVPRTQAQRNSLSHVGRKGGMVHDAA